MWRNPQETVDLVTFAEEILNGKLHFLCSDNSRIRPVPIKFLNPSIKTNLIRNDFKLKDIINSISIDRTKEERNAFKRLLREKGAWECSQK